MNGYHGHVQTKPSKFTYIHHQNQPFIPKKTSPPANSRWLTTKTHPSIGYIYDTLVIFVCGIRKQITTTKNKSKLYMGINSSHLLRSHDSYWYKQIQTLGIRLLTETENGEPWNLKTFRRFVSVIEAYTPIISPSEVRWDVRILRVGWYMLPLHPKTMEKWRVFIPKIWMDP